MSEPVGNQPRKRTESLEGIPGNSHKERAAAPVEPAEREPVTKIVEGKVVTRKQPWYKRAGRTFIADDAGNVGQYVVEDVLIPAIKKVVVDIVSSSIERLLFGTDRGRLISGRRPVGLALRDTIRYDRVRDDPRESRRPLSREARAKHLFDEIVLDNRQEAIGVIDAMADRIDRYGICTVADLYDFVGTTGSFADQRWGWNDLTTADVKQVSGGFLLDLPAPEPIR